MSERNLDPGTTPAPSPADHRSSSERAPAPVRILAVDDNEANLQALDGLLGDLAELVKVTSGNAALRELMERDFALILLDVRMPGQSGFDVARLIRSRPRSSHTPIIFLTASDNTHEQVLEGYALGAVDFLFKPIVPEILISKANVFLELHRQTESAKRKEQLLREADRREHQHRLAELQTRLEEQRLLEEIEQERRLSNERVAAIKARDEFISIASHELRTPLTPLTLRVQSLKQGVLEHDFGHLFENATKIEGYIQRLIRLVDMLLDVSRVTHGELELHQSDVELGQLLGEVVDHLEGDRSRSGSSITLSQVAPVNGHWDRVRLDQIFSNLLSNAIKYGLGKPIELTVTTKPGAVSIAVTDHGIGIAPRDQERVFERFERAVPHTHFGGFGLGLWIVRHLIEAHRGSIQLESAPGHGTTVLVSLPLAG